MYQLQIRGLSFAELARRNGGVDRAVPVKTFCHDYPKWERIIAAAIDMKPEELWPERYAAREAKKAARPACKRTRKRRVSQ